jgi:hypothetical protein
MDGRDSSHGGAGIWVDLRIWTVCGFSLVGGGRVRVAAAAGGAAAQTPGPGWLRAIIIWEQAPHVPLIASMLQVDIDSLMNRLGQKLAEPVGLAVHCRRWPLWHDDTEGMCVQST